MTTQMPIDEVTHKVIGAAMTVHSALGPGLLEKAYDACLQDELKNVGLQFEHQVRVAVSYHGKQLQSRFCIDYVVEN